MVVREDVAQWAADQDAKLGLFLGKESDSERKEQQPENEIADTADNIAVAYIESDVLTKRNLTFDYSRLPPRGRLKYFTCRADDCADSGVGTACDGTTCLNGPERSIA